ncbi:MAG: PDZ domain-containing protein, partial [Acidobacteriia bacterium]|nr:PDZ domain-containing protein [Terriglobia bacterium]
MLRPRALFLAVLVVAASQAVGHATENPDARPQGWLGAALVPVRAPSGESDTPVPGALVRGVVDGGAAEEAGLRSRDVILGIDGVAIASP